MIKRIEDFKYFDIHHIEYRKKQISLKYDELYRNKKDIVKIITPEQFDKYIDQFINDLNSTKSNVIGKPNLEGYDDYNEGYLQDPGLLNSIAEYYSIDIIGNIQVVENAINGIIKNQVDTSIITIKTDINEYFRNDPRFLENIILTEPIKRDGIAFYFYYPGYSYLGRFPLLIMQNHKKLSNLFIKLRISKISDLLNLKFYPKTKLEEIWALNNENSLILNHFIEVYEKYFYEKLKVDYHQYLLNNRTENSLKILYNEFNDYYNQRFINADGKQLKLKKEVKKPRELFDPLIGKFDYQYAPFVQVEQRGKGLPEDYFYHEEEDHSLDKWIKDGSTFFRSIENLHNYNILETMYHMRNQLFKPWLKKIVNAKKTTTEDDQKYSDFYLRPKEKSALKKAVQGKLPMNDSDYLMAIAAINDVIRYLKEQDNSISYHSIYKLCNIGDYKTTRKYLQFLQSRRKIPDFDLEKYHF